MSRVGVGYAWISHKKGEKEENDRILDWYLNEAQKIQNRVRKWVIAFNIVICGNGQKEAR
jgi:hypothetical protein